MWVEEWNRIFDMMKNSNVIQRVYGIYMISMVMSCLAKGNVILWDHSHTLLRKISDDVYTNCISSRQSLETCLTMKPL